VLHDLAGRATAQGTPPTLRSTLLGTDLQFDYYSGFDDVGLSGVIFFYGIRVMYDPALANSSERQVEGPTTIQWSSMTTAPSIAKFGCATCQVKDSSPSDLDPFINVAHADSVQIGVENQTRCGRFAATACGQVDGGYWDNIRMGFIQAKPALSTFFW